MEGTSIPSCPGFKLYYTDSCSSDRTTHLIAVDYVITRLSQNTRQPPFCNNHLSLWVSVQYLIPTPGHFEVRCRAPCFRKTKPGRALSMSYSFTALYPRSKFLLQKHTVTVCANTPTTAQSNHIETKQLKQ